jgi:hypothetical protein
MGPLKVVRSIEVFGDVNANPARFYDPQCALDGVRPQGCQEISQSPYNAGIRGSRPNFEDYYSGALLRRETQYLTEITIQSDKGSSLRCTNPEQILVGDATQILIKNR